MTENKMETWVPMIHEKYWTESGRGDGQGDLQSYQRPHMMEKPGDKEEIHR